MVRARFKPVPPDQRIRELRKEFAALGKEEPSPERAERLAAFTRAAHDERQLNMAMHTAQLCLEDDPDAPTLLVAAYAEPDTDIEEQLRVLSDLEDLGRYVSRDDLRTIAREGIERQARAWIETATESEQRHRLRTLASIFGRAFADDVRDAVR